MRIIQGIMIGIFGMGLAQGIACCFMDTSYLSRGSFLGNSSRSAAFIFGTFFGIPEGIFICGITAALDLSLPLSLILSFGLSVMACLFFMYYMNGGLIYDYLSKYMMTCYLILGTIFGTLVSWLSGDNN